MSSSAVEIHMQGTEVLTATPDIPMSASVGRALRLRAKKSFMEMIFLRDQTTPNLASDYPDHYRYLHPCPMPWHSPPFLRPLLAEYA